MKNIFSGVLFVLLMKMLVLGAEIPPELKNLSYAVYPGDIEYNTVRFNKNKRFNICPKAIFYPTTEQEAAYVLSVLKQYELKFAVRSGGHCYEPGSLSSGYIIDLSEFDEIIPDVQSSRVYIGAGTRLGDVINTLGAIDYAIPLGTCPTNCITGYTLGGGIGLLGRKYGLGCDSVQSITFLTADSEVIEVNENNYPDLFWALCGGGNGSYGIALGFTYTMYYIPIVSYYDLKWNWNPKTFPKIFQAWQEWVLSLPENISTIMRLTYENEKVYLNIFGLKISDEPFTEWENAFEKFHPEVIINQESFLDSSKSWATESPLPFNKAKSKIMMRPLSKKVPPKIANFFEQLLSDKPKISVFFEFEAFGGIIPQFDTSFFPRNAFGWWYQAYYWGNKNDTQQALRYSRKFYSKTSHNVSRYSYANTVDYDIGKHYLNAYYGDKTSRLIHVKRKYDPTNLFHWTQSIPLRKPNRTIIPRILI